MLHLLIKINCKIIRRDKTIFGDIRNIKMLMFLVLDVKVKKKENTIVKSDINILSNFLVRFFNQITICSKNLFVFMKKIKW